MKPKPDIQPVDRQPPCDEEWIIPDYLAELLREDPAIGGELIDLFIGDTIKQVSELQQAVSGLANEKVKKLLHGMKGSCAQMGALGLADSCARLDSEIDSVSPLYTSKRVDEIRACCEHLISRMKAWSNIP